MLHIQPMASVSDPRIAPLPLTQNFLEAALCTPRVATPVRLIVAALPCPA